MDVSHSVCTIYIYYTMSVFSMTQKKFYFYTSSCQERACVEMKFILFIEKTEIV